MKRKFSSQLFKIIVLPFILLFTSCGEKAMNTSAQKLESKSIAGKDWKKLSEKKIYFGHMSVGYNIIDGMKDLLKINPEIMVNIQETTNLISFTKGVFAHSQNGENIKPKTKIDAFVKTMDGGMAQQADIAFFKFCYIDFNNDTDVIELFNYYRSSMSALSKKHQKVTFLHMTVPLTTENESLGLKNKAKDIIKKILGRETNNQQNITANLKRSDFNKLIRKEYEKKLILDLEQFESTNIDGTPHISNNGGTVHNSLVPAFTFDGGHLNEKGRIWVADRILTHLAGFQQ